MTPPPGAYSIAAAARALGIAKPEFYGVLRAYGIRPAEAPAGAVRGRGRPAKLITPDQLVQIRRRLAEASAA